MAVIVAVHGIGQQYAGAHSLAAAWLPAMLDGLERSGFARAEESPTLSMAFYGDLFRGAGKAAGTGVPPYGPADVAAGYEQDLLLEWWRAAAETEPQRVPAPDGPTPHEPTKVYSPQIAQRALRALAASSFFSAVPERLVILLLKQLRQYFLTPESGFRAEIGERVDATVEPDTRVLVGHSLGSVVAYEALCRHPEWRITTLVTLGSPLGVSKLVFDRLAPAPVGGRGSWPGSVRRWVNVAGYEDTVALIKRLAPLFGDRVEDHIIRNGVRAHDVTRYLNTLETGRVIASALG